MTEPPINDRLLRVLAYLELVEKGGGTVSTRQIDMFAALPIPGQSLDYSAGLHTTSLMISVGLAGNPMSSYMRSVGWITEGNDSPKLTDLGRAVAAATRADAATDEPTGVVILSPDDPLNLGTLTGAIGNARAGMLVDPYFTDSLFQWLIGSTSINRLLLCRQPSKREALGLYAGGARRVNRSLDVRCLPPNELHDRYLVYETGDVSMIGASLNGLHRNFTAIVPVPAPGDDAIRDYVNAKWEEADRIEPVDDIKTPGPGTETESVPAEPDSSPG